MLIAVSIIFTTQVISRKYGLCLYPSYVIYVVATVGFTGWLLPLSYQKAPAFLPPYFLSIAGLSILGFCGSVYFRDILRWYNWLGALLISIGAVLIILKK
jgi:hypothetical protein